MLNFQNNTWSVFSSIWKLCAFVQPHPQPHKSQNSLPRQGGAGYFDFKKQSALLLLSTTLWWHSQAQPPCGIQFSQCPGETTVLACPNSPNGFTLYTYPPVSAYLTGACPAGATLVVQQTAGPTLPAVIPPGGYLIQYHAFLYVNGQPTGQAKACTFQLFVVQDNQPPVFTYCPPPITIHGTLDNNGNCTATGQWPIPIFTDNCGPNPFLPGGLQVNIPCGSTLGAGTHTITYTAWDGSSNSSTCSFTVTVLCPSGTDGPGAPIGLEAFPNPTDGALTIVLPAGLEQNTRLFLTEVAGRVLRSPDIPEGASSMVMHLDDLQPGMYFIKVLAADRLFEVAKVVKQ